MLLLVGVKARGQAAAPPQLGPLPQHFRAVNHSAPNQSDLDQGNLALKASPHLGSASGLTVLFEEAAGNGMGFAKPDCIPRKQKFPASRQEWRMEGSHLSPLHPRALSSL